MDKEFLSIKEVAEYLNVKTSTLYTWIDDIPHYRVGRLVRFKKRDIDAWMDARRREGSESSSHKGIRMRRNPADISVDRIVQSAIDEVKARPYNSLHGKSGRFKSPGKED